MFIPYYGGTERLMVRDANVSGGDTNGEGKNFSHGEFVKILTGGGKPPSPPPLPTRETLNEIPEFLLNDHKKFVSLVVRSPETPLKLVERSLDIASSCVKVAKRPLKMLVILLKIPIMISNCSS